MTSENKILGIILARGGSKGLPGKNTRVLCGKPLIAWSINAALESKYIDDVIVSTDDEKIAEISRNYGAETPFLRPPALATDDAKSIDAILHALDFLAGKSRYYDTLALLEPTSPLRTPSDIDSALGYMLDNNLSSVVSVCKAESAHPSFMFSINPDNRLSPLKEAYPNSLRRQDILPLYYLDGTIYCSKIKTLRAEKGFYHSETFAYLVPKWKALEIDDLDDFLMVEAIMKAKAF